MPIYNRETLSDNELTDAKYQISPTSPKSIGWSSEPQLFLSSEPSSPVLNSAEECSMSMNLVSTDGSRALADSKAKYATNHGLELDYVEFCMRIEQETRESRGSVSYTDYYSSEDGQIRRSVNDNCLPLFVRPAYCASSSAEHSFSGVNCDNDVNNDLREDPITKCIDQIKNQDDEDADDDKDRTLTLKQPNRQNEHDLKLIFKQSNNKSNTIYKKIGRFRVQSMDNTDKDVRIREIGRHDSSLSFRAQSTISLSTASAIKTNSLLRSQSVYTPKMSTPIDTNTMAAITKETPSHSIQK